MKKLIPILFAVALISGCSTTNLSLKPHPEKYTFQVVGIELPAEALRDKNRITSSDADKIIQHPDAKIIEYPVVVAGRGESVTNDQTKSASFPENWEVVDGEPVIKEKMIKLGHSVTISFDELEDGVISYNLEARYNKLAGFNEYPMEKGSSVKMPIFKNRSIDTNLKQGPNSWISMGNVISKNPDGEQIAFIMCVRVIPPKTI